MQTINLQRTTLFFGLLIIYLLGWAIEANTFVPGDISLGLRESLSLFMGGAYGKDFFEVNPPLFLYLYMPCIVLAQYIHLNLFTLFHLYIFALISLSLLLTYPSIKRIFPAGDWRVCGSLLLLAFILILLPMPTAFGQREHLLLILTFPYLGLMVCRLEGCSINPFFALIIGLMAGLGFAIKPFFCLTLALVELYYLFQQRRWFAWARAETLAIAFIFLAYLYSIYRFNQDYLNLVLPFALRLYYQGFSASWSRLLLKSFIVFCALPVVVYFLQKRSDLNKNLSVILLLGTLGYAGSYLMQRTIWYYHLYPAYALALMLSVQLLYLLNARGTQAHRYLVSMIYLVTFLYSLPLVYTEQGYTPSRLYTEKANKLIQFLQQYAWHQPVYFLATTLRIEYPLVDYAQSLHASKYPSVWWLYGYLNQMHNSQNPALREQLQQDREYFLDSIISELKTNKPALVFVESGPFAPYFDNREFNYISDFSRKKEFRKVWEHYHYLTDIDEPSFYHFEVYQRNS